MFANSMLLCTLLCLSTGTVLTLKCSNKWDFDYQTLDNFTDHMCLYCFDTMRIGHAYPNWVDDTVDTQWEIDLIWNGSVIMTKDKTQVLYRLHYNKLKEAFEANRTEEEFILKRFSSDFYRNAFMKCCDDARKCCQKSVLADTPKGHCPVHWDGWNCWDSASPGTVEATCPDMSLYLLGYLPRQCVRETASKVCDANGEWEKVKNPYYHNLWTGQTNYGAKCYYSARGVRWATSTTTIILESVSLVCTTVGLVLFLFYKLYSQFRLQIHVNFFVSVMLTSVIVLHYELLVNRAHIENSNTSLLNHPFLCKALNFLQKDIRLMNFFWMLIEGFNFHHMVVFTFTDLSKFRLPIYLFGWGLPHVIMFVYAIVRSNVSDDLCWTTPIGWWELIYIIPAYACFFINLLLFINLLRVIVIKLMLPKLKNSSYMKRGVKTSLVLLPIFGLQYIIQGLPIDATETCNRVYISLLYLQTIVEGAQGVIITTALCFLNKEVYSCVRKSINSIDGSSMLTATNSLSDDSRRSS